MNLKDKPAFPRPMGGAFTKTGGEYNASQSGMTLLQYYAGLAMQGALADPEVNNPDALAKFSVKCANALIAELEKGGVA